MPTLLSALLLAAVTSSTAVWPIHTLHEASAPVERLPPADRALVSRLLRSDLGPLFQGEPPQATDNALRSFRAERLHLGDVPVIVVQGSGEELCSSTGNCSLWVIDLQHRRILLNDRAQTFAVDRNSPSGRPDVVTGLHNSATESDLTRWHFDGTSYQRSECATAEYADADGKPYPAPRFTPHPCNEGNDSSR